ncbi:unnamed protein product [Periconia digitata]|uniref:Uncharacterized protein n=1 Tax=Periconia digitata TaxID=1303443 RepID=A0A9W4U9P5_9PLEO|nr:unnamed protein product [Periconia digitata]
MSKQDSYVVKQPISVGAWADSRRTRLKAAPIPLCQPTRSTYNNSGAPDTIQLHRPLRSGRILILMHVKGVQHSRHIQSLGGTRGRGIRG